MQTATPRYLEMNTWPRRAVFDFFRGFDIPCFNICTRLDVSALRGAVRASGTGSLSLAYHYIAIRLANEIAPFRYRLEGDRVRVHDVVYGSTTVLRGDETFGFATLPYHPDYATFAAQAADSIDRARHPDAQFEPGGDDTATLHMTTLPWMHFTSYSNARQRGLHDSIPKIAFGRIDADGGRQWMPLSVEVHHALMDGLHVGRFIEGFEAALREPDAWLMARGATN